MINDLKPLIAKLTIFAKSRMGFSHPPRLFLKQDAVNSQKMLGRTAHYDPQNQSVTLYISARHPKDILRSYAHELVHHLQNLRGDLDPKKMGSMGDRYAQENDYMRNMEKEAYLQGNMCFRDFEDGLDDEDKKKYKLAESKFIKENKTMTTKITKEFLKEMIEKVLENQIESLSEKELEETDEAEAEVVEEEVEELEENEELEEKKGKKKSKAKGKVPKTEKEKKFAKLAPPKDKITFADKIAGATQVAEGKVQTPEQENTLYEQRFTPKNNRLYEKLVKQWTK